jgi:hypothetical protein
MNLTRRTSRTIRIYCCALAVVTASCHRTSNNVVPNCSADLFSAAVAHDRYADDLGRFHAGLPARDGSPVGELEKQPAWIEHRQELDRAWSGMERLSLSAMRVFQKQELGANAIPQATALIPSAAPTH